jgi:hypothetical protein
MLAARIHGASAARFAVPLGVRLSATSRAGGTVSFGAMLAARIHGASAARFAVPLALAAHATATGRIAASLRPPPPPMPLAGRIRGGARAQAQLLAFSIALGGRLSAVARSQSTLEILIPAAPSLPVQAPAPLAFQVYEIPMVAGVPSFQVIRLSGTILQVAAHWCAPLNAWVLDLADVAGNAIVSGIPMITGADLLAQYRYLNLGGALVAQSDFDWTTPPTFDNLGRFGHLYWIPWVQPSQPAPRFPFSPQDRP